LSTWQPSRNGFPRGGQLQFRRGGAGQSIKCETSIIGKKGEEEEAAVEAARKEEGLREPLVSATFVLEPDGTILDAAGDARAFLGAGAKESISRRLGQVSPELQRSLGGLLEKAARGKGVEDYALAFKVGKRLLPMRAAAVPYPLPAQGSTGILLSIRSLEEKPAAARAVGDGKALRLPIPGLEDEGSPEELDGFADPLCVLDQEGRLDYANPAMARLLEMGQEELRGTLFSDWLAREEAVPELEPILETARLAPWRGELELRGAGGGTASLLFTFSPLRGRGEGVRAVLAYGMDLGEFRRAQRQWEDEAVRLRGLLQGAGFPLLACTREGFITHANREAAELLGLPLERMARLRLHEVLGEEGARVLQGLMDGEPGPATGGAVFTRSERGGGEKALWIEVRPLAGKDGAQECAVTLEDRTARLALEERAAQAGRLVRFLDGVAGALSGHGEGGNAWEPLMQALLEMAGAEAGALYVFEEDSAVPLCVRGLGEGGAGGNQAWRIRPNRLVLLKEAAVEALDLDGGGAAEDARSPSALLRDWEGFRLAHLKEGSAGRLVLLRRRGEAVGMLVLSGGRVSRAGGEDSALRAGLALAGALLGLTAPGSAVEGAGRSEGRKEGTADGGPATGRAGDDTLERLRHMLSTPLTYIRGFAQMLVEEGLEEDQRREAARNVFEGADRLRRIVESVLPAAEDGEEEGV
jgi:PAS domain S-box-containing protein